MLKKTLILIFLLINLPVQAFSLTFDMEVIPNPISDRGGYAYDINNSGQIAVQFITDNGERRSFLYQNGLTTDLGSLRDDYPYNKVYGLNENGQAVGGSPGYPYGYRAYSYENGSLMNLGTLYSNDDGSEARAVNNHSQIVGNSGGRAFLYDNGVMIDILGNYGSAFDINDSGQIVGSFLTPGSSTIQHAYIYENGSLNDLGTLGGPHSWAYGINEMGEVVGGSYMNNVDDEYHAFLYSGGSMLDLGTLGGRQSTAWGVNNRGWVVGDSETTNGEWHGFLWINGVMHDLGTLGGSNSRAYAANDSGDIVGFAMTDTSTHTNEKLAVHWKVVPILSEYNVFTLTNNSHHDWYPHLNDIGSASWISGTGVNGNWYNQVYLYESGSIKIISIDNSYYNSPPIINNNNQVVWSATRGTEGEMYNKAVFFYDGYQTLKLFEYVDDRNIQVDLNNNGFVVWNRAIIKSCV